MISVTKSLAIHLMVALAVPAAAEEFRILDLRDPNHPSRQAIVYMGEQLKLQTAGRHTVKALQQSATNEITLQQVKLGNIAMAVYGLALFHPIVPASVVPSLPYVFRSERHQHEVLDGPIGDDILADFESEGLVGLCFYDVGARSFFSVRRKIRHIDDLRGMRIRVQPGEIMGPILRSVGAIPTILPFLRVYDHLKVGALDGGEFDLVSWEGARYPEVARYYSFTRHNMIPRVVVFSKKLWDGLSAEDRAGLRVAARASARYHRAIQAEAERTARRSAEAAGAEFVADVDRQSFVEAMVPAGMRLVVGSRQKELLRQVQEVGLRLD